MILTVQIFFLFLQLGIVIFMFYMCLAFLTGAPFVPSNDPTAEAMIHFANIQKGTKVYDLGSGNGKLLFRAAQKGAIATGYEINPMLVLFTNIRTLFSPYRKTVKTIWKNFWGADLSEADVVFVYLLPYRMEKLENKLKRELKPGALVVSNSFMFPHWKLLRKDAAHHVFVYRD